ncbi:MAG: hypothetical protein GF368_04150 [Candidatus Aenigmarchaeota archaeon]|nr:hypothetical protein [Candidatus Aenigmarchaeota archaeon]
MSPVFAGDNVDLSLSPGGVLFELDDIKPGDVYTRTLTLTNSGPIHIYGINLTTDYFNSDPDDDGSDLADVLYVELVYEGMKLNGGPQLLGDGLPPLTIKELTEGYIWDNVGIGIGSSKELNITIIFDQSAGNEYQGDSLEVNFTFAALAPEVVISEIMYNPTRLWGGSNNEWIEIYNRDDEPIDMQGWTLNVGVGRFTFPENSVIPANGYLIISGDQFIFNYIYDISCPVIEASLNLDNDDETISLKYGNEDILDFVSYDDDWGADGNCKTLEKINLNGSSEGDNWEESLINGGSPCSENSINDQEPPIIENPKAPDIFLGQDQTITVNVSDLYGSGIDEVLVEDLKDYKKFDFQPDTSPVESGFIKITKSTLYIPSLGYGWSNSPFGSRDRNIGSDLERDLIFGPNNREFKVDLPNGDYIVTVLLGDLSYSHDNMDVFAEGDLKLDDISTSSGQIEWLDFFVNVNDATLNMEFSDDGGIDPNWVSEGLIIKSLDNYTMQPVKGTIMGSWWFTHMPKYATYYTIVEEPVEGEHEIRFYVKDNLGNTNDDVKTTYYVDKTELGIGGKIAYLCHENTCNSGTETKIIGWLRDQGWEVDGKKYNSWIESELNDYDIMICSDQLEACDISLNSDIYDLHKNQEKPLVEISDSRSARAAYNFGYTNDRYGYNRPSTTDLFVTETDPITVGYFGETQIFSSGNSGSVMMDSDLGTEVIDLADFNSDSGESAVFKVDLGSNGRYAWLSWFNGYSFFGRFYGTDPSDLNSDGEEILRRIINWAQCGNSTGCEINSNPNGGGNGGVYVCDEGEKRCSDDILQGCQDNSWLDLEDCVWGCSGDTCNSPMSFWSCYRECRYNRNHIEACFNNYYWMSWFGNYCPET